MGSRISNIVAARYNVRTDSKLETSYKEKPDLKPLAIQEKCDSLPVQSMIDDYSEVIRKSCRKNLFIHVPLSRWLFLPHFQLNLEPFYDFLQH